MEPIASQERFGIQETTQTKHSLCLISFRVFASYKISLVLRLDRSLVFPNIFIRPLIQAYLYFLHFISNLINTKPFLYNFFIFCFLPSPFDPLLLKDHWL